MNIFFKILILFFIYSFIGWVIETIYCSIISKRLINRGFLKGPYCPMYGFSALIIINILDFVISKLNLSSNYFYVSIFLVSIIVATIVEFFTGLLIEKIFKMRLWDYSNRDLNIKGYVCLQFSLYWGALSFILLTIINPIFSSVSSFLSSKNYKYIFLVFLILIIFDFLITLKSLFIFNKLTNKINILNSNKIFEGLKKYKRILRNFVPNFYYFNNKKSNNLKNKIIKTILRR